jgi:hypothetical protein
MTDRAEIVRSVPGVYTRWCCTIGERTVYAQTYPDNDLIYLETSMRKPVRAAPGSRIYKRVRALLADKVTP